MASSPAASSAEDPVHGRCSVRRWRSKALRARRSGNDRTTRRSGGGSRSLLVATMRLGWPSRTTAVVLGSHGAIPTKTNDPSSDHRGARNRATRSSSPSAPLPAPGSNARITSGVFTRSGQTSVACVEPSCASSLIDRSAASAAEFFRQVSPEYEDDDESSTRTMRVAVSNSCTPLPTPPSTVVAMASNVPSSCQAVSETDPNVMSRPVASSRTINVVPGLTVSFEAVGVPEAAASRVSGE
jgi:hypothetical protein